MRKNLGKQTYAYPMPVFIIGTYDEKGNANAMNAAWGGIHDTNQLGICLSPEHKTVKNILLKKEFTVSMGQADYVVPCDYVGIASGNTDSGKMQKSGFHVTKAENVDAPLIDELSMALECRLVSYDETSGYLVADIVNVSVDEKILDENGNVDVAKLQPITYDPVNHAYYVLGAKVGNAFKDGLKLK